MKVFIPYYSTIDKTVFKNLKEKLTEFNVDCNCGYIGCDSIFIVTTSDFNNSYDDGDSFVIINEVIKNFLLSSVENKKIYFVDKYLNICETTGIIKGRKYDYLNLKSSYESINDFFNKNISDAAIPNINAYKSAKLPVIDISINGASSPEISADRKGRITFNDAGVAIIEDYVIPSHRYNVTPPSEDEVVDDSRYYYIL